MRVSKSNSFIGFLQAACVTAYVGVFAILVNRIQEASMFHRIDVGPVAGIMLFLLTFVVSALVCGGLVFGYPAILFFEGKKKDSLALIAWSGVWLIVFLVVLLFSFFASSSALF